MFGKQQWAPPRVGEELRRHGHVHGHRHRRALSPTAVVVACWDVATGGAFTGQRRIFLFIATADVSSVADVAARWERALPAVPSKYVDKKSVGPSVSYTLGVRHFRYLGAALTSMLGTLKHFEAPQSVRHHQTIGWYDGTAACAMRRMGRMGRIVT